jgi:putative transcriptional regulator
MIEVRLGAVMGQKKIRIAGLSRQTGLARTTLTNLWYGRAKGINFDTLEAICKELDCQPGYLLVYVPDDAQNSTKTGRKQPG